jgi:hypothetical protein
MTASPESFGKWCMIEDGIFLQRSLIREYTEAKAAREGSVAVNR